MALTGSSIATTYLKLLRITNDTIGTDETAYYIQDSADTASALSISTTRVGIGTDAPNSLLHVNSTATSSGSIAEFYRAVDADGEYVAQWIGKAASVGDSLALSYYYDTGTDAYAELSIYGSNGLIVKEGGNVGIGTVSYTHLTLPTNREV